MHVYCTYMGNCGNWGVAQIAKQVTLSQAPHGVWKGIQFFKFLKVKKKTLY